MRNKDKIPVEHLDFNPVEGTRYKVLKPFLGYGYGNIIEFVSFGFDENPNGPGGYGYAVFSGSSGVKKFYLDGSFPEKVGRSFEVLETLSSDYEKYPESIRQIVMNLEFRTRRVRRDQAALIDKNTPHLEILIPKLYKLVKKGYDPYIIFGALNRLGNVALEYMENLIDEIADLINSTLYKLRFLN